MRANIARIMSTAAIALVAALLAPAQAEVLYVSNFGTNTVTAYDTGNGLLLGTPVTAGVEANGFNGVRTDGASFFVTGQFTDNAVQYGASGALVRVLDPTNTAGLDSPQDLAFGPDGKLYVVSSANDLILRYDAATGAFLDVFADIGGKGHIGPIGLAFGPDGNLYVSGFDNDVVIALDGAGTQIGSWPGPPGFGFGAAAFGPDKNLYLAALDLTTFAGSVIRFNPATLQFDTFIAPGTGGLQAAGGIAFTAAGDLLLANVVFDSQSFADLGSTILDYNGTTGGFKNTLVGSGQGLNTPFFMTVVGTVTPVPEPSTLALFGIVLIAALLRTATADSNASA